MKTQQRKTTLSLYINRSEKMLCQCEIQSRFALTVFFGTGDVGLIPITKTPGWCCWTHMPQSRIMAHMPAKIRGPPACCTPGLCELPYGKARCEVISCREAFLISWFELVLTEGYMLVWWRNKGSDS